MNKWRVMDTKEKIENINNYIGRFVFYELSILTFKDGVLVIAGSDDFLYYHNIEIVFTEVSTIICNSMFKLNTELKSINILEDIQEMRDVNLKYRVEIGNIIFKIIDEDACVYYIIAKNIDYNTSVIKYPVSVDL